MRFPYWTLIDFVILGLVALAVAAAMGLLGGAP